MFLYLKLYNLDLIVFFKGKEQIFDNECKVLDT